MGEEKTLVLTRQKLHVNHMIKMEGLYVSGIEQALNFLREGSPDKAKKTLLLTVSAATDSHKKHLEFVKRAGA